MQLYADLMTLLVPPERFILSQVLHNFGYEFSKQASTFVLVLKTPCTAVLLKK